MSPLATAQLVETLTMGGAENLAVQIANARAAAGERARLYVLTGPGMLASRVAPAVEVRYLGLDRAPVRRPARFLATVTGGLRRIAHQVRTDGVQVVQTHLPGANFWGLLLALRGVCAVVATVHNTREFDYGDRDHPVRRRLRHAAYRQILRRCDATVAVSPQVKTALLAELDFPERRARRFEVVTNGVPVPAPLTSGDRAAIRQRWGAGPAVPLLVAAGRLTEQKDFGNLVDAAARLQGDGRDFRVVIGGEGELGEQLAGRIADLGLAGRVVLPGNLVDLPEVLLAADVFVLPSRWEGLPLVLLEAMASGLPVAATRLEGLDELVATTGAGVLVPPGDSEALAGAIAALLDDPDRRAACGRRAREVIEARYDFRRVSEQLGRLYAELAAAREGSRC